MIEYALGCATVGAVWLFWPRLKAWLSGEATKVETQAKADLSAGLSAVAQGAKAEAQGAKAGLSALKQGAQADLDQLKGKP